MSVRRGTWVPAVAMLLCALVACGGGDDGDDADTGGPLTGGSTPPATRAEAADDVATGTAPPATTTPPPTTAPPTTAPPAEPLLVGVDPVEVRSPAGSDDGPTPEFGWEPVDGAADYRLVVLGPDGPIWAWQGAETSVWLGGFSVEPPPGAAGLAIVDGACWSVVARDADGSIVAASALLPIAPVGEPVHTCDPA